MGNYSQMEKLVVGGQQQNLVASQDMISSSQCHQISLINYKFYRYKNSINLNLIKFNTLIQKTGHKYRSIENNSKPKYSISFIFSTVLFSY